MRIRQTLALLVLALLVACAANRPPAPPPGITAFGAVHLDHGYGGRDEALREQLAGHYDSAYLERLARQRDGDLVHPVLSLSGGGSYVAFAAGVLTGWSAHGRRPAFRLVTAMAGGSPVAPWAFLGANDDPVLEEIFTTIDTGDVYRVGALGLGGGRLSMG